MKKILFLLTALLFLSAGGAAFAQKDNPIPQNGLAPVAAESPVKAEDRACQADSDCTLVPLSCDSCCPMQETGALDAVNSANAKTYESLGVCTPEHIKNCGVPECGLALAPYPVATCREGVCAVTMHAARTAP